VQWYLQKETYAIDLLSLHTTHDTSPPHPRQFLHIPMVQPCMFSKRVYFRKETYYNEWNPQNETYTTVLLMINHDTGLPHPKQLLYVTVIHSYLFSKRDLLLWMITAKRDLYSGITYDWSRHRSTASEAASLRYRNPLLFILKKRPITVNDNRKMRPIQRYYLWLVTTQVNRIRGSFFTLQ